MALIKPLVEATLRTLGYELRRIRPAVAKPIAADPIEAQRRLLGADDSGGKGVCIFDVGANKGEVTRKYRAAFPHADIYSFEPFPACVAALRQRFAGDGKIHVVPQAMGRVAGSATFFVNGMDATNSLLPRPAAARRYYPKIAATMETIEVGVIDLDGFARTSNIAAIDILKFDIQGGELEALRGADSLLRTSAIPLIYTEIMFVEHYERSPLFHEIWSLLSGYGYSLFDIYDLHRAGNGQLRYGDALFVSQSIRANVLDRYPEEA